MGAREATRQDRKESESRKREGVGNKVSKSPGRCRQEFDFPAHLPACQSNCQNTQQHPGLLLVTDGEEGARVTGSVHQPSNMSCLFSIPKQFTDSETSLESFLGVCLGREFSKFS